MSSGNAYLQAGKRHREHLVRVLMMAKPFVNQDHALRAMFDDDAVSCQQLVETLTRYFWQAQLHYVDEAGTLAYYPGRGSIYGARNDAIEGVTRLAPLWAAYACSDGADQKIACDMLSYLHRSMVNGTTPSHPGYWGHINDRSLLICEAADVALALWIARHKLIPLFSSSEIQLVFEWLRQAVGKTTADNNWHLFVALVDAVLSALAPSHSFDSFDRLERVKSFQRADGCFIDGPRGRVDYYNAWGFQYGLFWLREIVPGLNLNGMDDSIGPFCKWYQLLFTNHGLPLFGRSLCYRFATTVPLLIGARRCPEIVSEGVALSALRSIWQYFGREGGLVVGRPTQGVFGDDLRWVDPYSGPASSLWGVRSLVMYLYLSSQIRWTEYSPAPLPAVLEETTVYVEGLGATVSTNPQLQTTSLVLDEAWTRWNAVEHSSARSKLRKLVFAVPYRPDLVPKGDGKSFSSNLELYRS